MKYTLKLVVFLNIFLFICFNALSQGNYEWTRFRGANGTGIDTKWKAPNICGNSQFLWQIDLPGRGHSSPVVWENNIFVSSSDDEANIGYLIAVDSRDGRIQWQYDFELTELAMHVDNNLASASPVVDESLIYTIWYSAEMTKLVALTHEGVTQWEASFDGIVSRHGGGSSLMLTEKDVVFTREQETGSPHKSSWLAVNKKTGKTSWELFRKTNSSNSFSTPALLEIENQKSQLIFSSQAHGLTSVDAETGVILWEIPDAFAARTISSPIFSDGMLIGFYKGGGAVYELDKDNKPVADTALYSFSRSLSPYVPTPIVVGELLFQFMDNGMIACTRLASGEVLWNERPNGPFYGSPVCVDGSLFCITKTGIVMKILAESTFQLSGILELGEGSHSSPAMCSQGMILRTFSKLMLLKGLND